MERWCCSVLSSFIVLAPFLTRSDLFMVVISGWTQWWQGSFQSGMLSHSDISHNTLTGWWVYLHIQPDSRWAYITLLWGHVLTRCGLLWMQKLGSPLWRSQSWQMCFLSLKPGVGQSKLSMATPITRTVFLALMFTFPVHTPSFVLKSSLYCFVLVLANAVSHVDPTE